ncbi:MAG TPA: hypothetical protein PK977_01510 [Chitinophagaceae bacterium]|nr:hypothetical protein [Chitinophagaceae bacterium]
MKTIVKFGSVVLASFLCLFLLGNSAYSQNSKKIKNGTSNSIQPFPETDINLEDKIRERQERYDKEEERRIQLNIREREESYTPLILNRVYKYLLPVALLLIIIFSSVSQLNIRQRIIIPFFLLIGLYLLGSLSVPQGGSATEYFENTILPGAISLVLAILLIGGSVYFLCEMPLPTKNHKIFIVLLTAVITGLLTLILTKSIILSIEDSNDIEAGKTLFILYPFNLLGFFIYNAFVYYRVFLSKASGDIIVK